jgi:hypothetical protein
MPDDKHQHESTSEASLPPPTHPPKLPQRDYSALPQKPITLKREINAPPALKQPEQKHKTRRETVTQKESIPRPKSAKAKQLPPANPWAQLGISPETEAMAISAAQRDGVTVGEWLEQVILQHTSEAQPPPPAEIENGLAESLKSIDERLGRLENHRGFWIRFWDRFMEQR